MRIIHVITRLIVGGAQENTVLSCRGLCNLGHDVTLVTGAETGPEGSLLEEARKTGCRVVVLDSLCRAPHPVRDARALIELRRLFRRDRPHVVHTHSSKAGILGRAAARWAGVPAVVHTNHGLPFHAFQAAPVRWLWRLIEMAAGPLADRIVCVGETMRRQSLQTRIAPPEKHVVIPSGMEVAPFLSSSGDADVRRRHGIPPDVPVIGCVGRIAPQKSPEDFVEAATLVMAVRADVRALWVGDGPRRQALERRVRTAGLHDRFTWAGLVSPAAVPPYFQAIDVFLLPSLWEGLPRVAVQAALSGRPVVAYASDGTSEVVQDGVTGYLVTPGDSRRMADRVLELLARPDRGRAMGSAGRALLAARFDHRRMVEALDTLYREIFQRRAARSPSDGRTDDSPFSDS
ncbi:MAG: glycosyltransferase family 4 protein [Planctomycetes bacterium]|nr:glycosyltransferase family 4 protein [Planctomycetota bacterium]